jgi:hypothetical protein
VFLPVRRALFLLTLAYVRDVDSYVLASCAARARGAVRVRGVRQRSDENVFGGKVDGEVGVKIKILTTTLPLLPAQLRITRPTPTTARARGEGPDDPENRAETMSASSSSSSSSSSSLHMSRLRESHGRMLTSWKALLTSNPSEAALALAFGKLLEEYPDAKRKVPGGTETMLSLALPRLFPSLSAVAPDVVESIVVDFLNVTSTNTQVRRRRRAGDEEGRQFGTRLLFRPFACVPTGLPCPLFPRAQEEMVTIAAERELQAKFAELDKLVAEVEVKGKEAR